MLAQPPCPSPSLSSSSPLSVVLLCGLDPPTAFPSGFLPLFWAQLKVLDFQEAFSNCVREYPLSIHPTVVFKIFFQALSQSEILLFACFLS